jgi:hypothetical protein
LASLASVFLSGQYVLYRKIIILEQES